MERTLEVYRLEGPHYALVDTFAEEQVVRAEPFDAIELPLESCGRAPRTRSASWPGGASFGSECPTKALPFLSPGRL